MMLESNGLKGILFITGFVHLIDITSCKFGQQPLNSTNSTVDHNVVKIWPLGIVPYKINPKLSRETVNIINSVLAYLEKRSCVRFRKWEPNYKTHVAIITGTEPGCASYLGCMGGGAQVLYLSNCNHFGRIVHEVLHTLGFWHAHSCRNQHKYMTIIAKNVKPGFLYNFYPANGTWYWHLPHDYASIMHYTQYAFGVNGSITILPKHKILSQSEKLKKRLHYLGVKVEKNFQPFSLKLKPRKLTLDYKLNDPRNMGQRHGLSNMDIIKLHLLYRKECIKRKMGQVHKELKDQHEEGCQIINFLN